MHGSTLEGRKLAVVTGGCRNLGLEISRAMFSHGFKVMATTRDARSCPDLDGTLSGIDLVEANVSTEGGVKSTFDRVRRAGSPIGVLVNNASTFPTGPLLSLSPMEVREALESTALSSFMCCKQAIPLMKGSGWGRIINIGMAGSDIVRGYREVAAHASAKTALAVLTLSFAAELEGSGVTINMVNPGPIDRNGLGREERARLSSVSPAGRLTRSADVVQRVLELVQGDVNGTLSTVL
jgi:3-oxoacyl-[acyl-carrier protein] reductase